MRTNNKLNPHDAETGNRTLATLVGGECSHHCAIPAPFVLYRNMTLVNAQWYHGSPTAEWASSLEIIKIKL